MAAVSAACSSLGPSETITTRPAHGERVDVAVEYAYVVNFGAGNVSAYSLDTTTGALTPVRGSPYAAGGDPNSAAVDPTGKSLYVANLHSNNVSAFTIDTTSGALAQLKNSPFQAGTQPLARPATAAFWVTPYAPAARSNC